MYRYRLYDTYDSIYTKQISKKIKSWSLKLERASMPPLLSLQATTILSFWVKTSARSVKLQIILNLSSNLFLQGLEETKTRVYRDTTVVCQTLQKCQIVYCVYWQVGNLENDCLKIWKENNQKRTLAIHCEGPIASDLNFKSDNFGYRVKAFKI